jgi:ABC-2 type transporter
MAVAYIPAALEDLSTFRKERANGLYGPLPFTLSNFLIGLPYLFLISIIFSVIAYWLSDFRPTAVSFWTWVMWLFLDLLAADLRRRAGCDGVCERAVDVCWRVHGPAGDVECFLEIHLSLHRLPSLRLPGHDGKPFTPEDYTTY